MNKIIKIYNNEYQIEDCTDRYLIRRLSDNFVLRAIEKNQCNEKTAIEIEDRFFKKIQIERSILRGKS